MGFYVKFWGVRGSIACPTLKHIYFGGNTSCVEVNCDGNRIILDAGTGLRQMGIHLLHKQVRNCVMLLSHTHWDHIDGFPFFLPIYQPAFSVLLMAGHLYGVADGIHGVIDKQMSNPYFPVPIQALKAELNLQDFKAGEPFDLYGGTVRVVTAALRHPGGATGYRIEFGGKAVCYVTDTEHVVGEPNTAILELIAGAELVIYDSTYTDDEFPGKVGWGHSTWQEGVRLCRQAGVKKLAIFHHDPAHDDKFMKQVAIGAREMWSGSSVAREGKKIIIA